MTETVNEMMTAASLGFLGQDTSWTVAFKRAPRTLLTCGTNLTGLKSLT